MNPRRKYVPTFDPNPIHPNLERAMFPSAPPLEIEAIGDNAIRLTIMGGTSRVLDGITLCDAINECIAKFRRSR